MDCSAIKVVLLLSLLSVLNVVMRLLLIDLISDV